MAVLTKEAWKMLLGGGSSVGNASVVAIILLVGTSHCAMVVSVTGQDDMVGEDRSQLSWPAEG